MRERSVACDRAVGRCRALLSKGLQIVCGRGLAFRAPSFSSCPHTQGSTRHIKLPSELSIDRLGSIARIVALIRLADIEIQCLVHFTQTAQELHSCEATV